MKNKFKKISIILFIAMFLVLGLTESVFADMAIDVDPQSSNGITSGIIWIGIFLALLVFIIFVIMIKHKKRGNIEDRRKEVNIKREDDPKTIELINKLDQESKEENIK